MDSGVIHHWLLQYIPPHELKATTNRTRGRLGSFVYRPATRTKQPRCVDSQTNTACPCYGVPNHMRPPRPQIPEQDGSASESRQRCERLSGDEQGADLLPAIPLPPKQAIFAFVCNVGSAAIRDGSVVFE